jgi:hypothetical protein
LGVGGVGEREMLVGLWEEESRGEAVDPQAARVYVIGSDTIW